MSNQSFPRIFDIIISGVLPLYGWAPPVKAEGECNNPLFV